MLFNSSGPALYAQEDCKHIFRSMSTFMGANVRKAVGEGRADAIPIFLHEIPLLFRRGILPIDVALINVSLVLPLRIKIILKINFRLHLSIITAMHH